MSPSPLTRTVTIRNFEGLHLRPSRVLVLLANLFEAEIFLSNNADQVDCRSILSIVTLGATDGTELTLSASGADAEAAIEVISDFFESGFTVYSVEAEVRNEKGDVAASGSDANRNTQANVEIGIETNPTPTQQI